jgi:two-component system, HptB-dependent secretion and biofilm response regulator
MTDTVNEKSGRAATGVTLDQRPLVLVTDDHDDTRLLFRTILAMHGCAVIEAADGEQAVRLTESASPDLILMDGVLPRLNGLDATRQIRTLGNARHTPIVFICGDAEPRYRAQALDAGCDEFLLKPLNFDLLGTVLEKHLGKMFSNLAT